MPPRYQNPGSRHFIVEAAGDGPEVARLRDRAGGLRPLAAIDTLLGQAESQADPVAESTFAAAREELDILTVGAEAGRRALLAFADARGFDPGIDGTGMVSVADAEAIRATVEGVAADMAIMAADMTDRDRRITELNGRLAEAESAGAKTDPKGLRAENGRLKDRVSELESDIESLTRPDRITP